MTNQIWSRLQKPNTKLSDKRDAEVLPGHSLETHHEDMIHDAKLDYYGKKLATCSSDRSIKIFEIDGDSQREIETLKGHEGPVWQVAWAHPKFVNSVAWAPHELGPILACASSDGKVSVLTFKAADIQKIDAHSIGVNSVSWAPATMPGSLVQITGGAQNVNVTKKFASAGCDNNIKIWIYSDNEWKEEWSLDGHTDWVRDVAWAPNVGLSKSYLASGSQDKTVLIWTQETPNSPWTKKQLNEKFLDAVWSVSWSLSGNILAVATADNKITLWKENLKGEWEMLTEMAE
nr:12413_t:CDS:2 [Entrophospora candida]